MKRLLAIIPVLVLVIVLSAGCGSKAPADSESDEVSNMSESSADAEAADETSSSLTPAQERWDGKWFGYMWITHGFEAYADTEMDYHDATMVVDIDKDGKGSLEIFIDKEKDWTVHAEIEADENHMQATEGMFRDMPLDTIFWYLVISGDFEGDIIVLTDTYTDPGGDGSFQYQFRLRPWGDLWEQEVNEGLPLPPGFDAYIASLGSGGSGGAEDTPSDQTASADNTGGGNALSHSANGVAFTVTIPEEGWSYEIATDPSYFKIYDKPPQEEYASNAPMIMIRIRNNADEYTPPKDAVPVAGRTIGGIAMEGNTYKEAFSTESTGFFGVFNDSNMIVVVVQNMDIEDATVNAILNSIKFTAD